MDVVEFIKRLDISVSPSSNDYFYKLKEVIGSKPFSISMNWYNNLICLTANKKKSDFSHTAINNMNGIILEIPFNENESPTVVAYSFPIIKDFNEIAEENIRENFTNYKVEQIIDGAIIRVFWYNDQWFTSTIKCIDAGRSSWEGKTSFKSLFEQAACICGLDYGNLNKEYCYTFVLCHPNNHMIVNYTEPKIYHVNTVNRNTEYIDEDIGITKPKQFTFETFDDFLKLVNTKLNPPIDDSQVIGFMLTNTKTNEKIKVDTQSYHEARTIKGNIPNIDYRIIQLLKESSAQQNSGTEGSNFDISNENIDKFCKYFPQYVANVDRILKNVEKLVGRLFAVYRNNDFQAPKFTNNHTNPMEFHILTELTYQHLETNQRSTYQVFDRYIKNLSVFRLATCLNVPYYNKFDNSKKYPHEYSKYIQY